MKTPSISTPYYAPGEVPSEAAQLPLFLRLELNKIRACLDILARGHIDPSYSEPEKPRNGDFAYADGTSWDPGSGKGFYINNGTSWVLIAAL